jgi:hypothetical protein
MLGSIPFHPLAGKNIPPVYYACMEHDPNTPKREFGPVIGTVIIITLLIAGGIYFFSKLETREVPPLFQVETGTAADF